MPRNVDRSKPAIERPLSERPDADGLAAPGMPLGSRGMPSSAPEHYDVMAFDEDGDSVFGRYVGTQER